MIFSAAEIVKITEACTEASAILMKYFGKTSELEIEEKHDNSPVTKADTESSDLLTKQLTQVLNIPVMSEENTEAQNLDILQNHKKFWLIDPLDGTWSYIKNRNTFVVNIALIENGKPIWGMIGIPTQEKIYYIDHKNNLVSIKDGEIKTLNQLDKKTKKIDFLVSSRNLNQQLEDLVNQYDDKTVTPIASAIKFCILVDGQADIYPRYKPTYSWDTAAGHALLHNIGGIILDANTRKELSYNKQLLNPSFIALRDKNIYLP